MNINTWRQSCFMDQPRFDGWAKEMKEKAKFGDRLRVVPSLLGNCICTCYRAEDAKWIAQRLNLAADLEQLAYDYAVGKKNGDELVKYVKDKLDS